MGTSPPPVRAADAARDADAGVLLLACEAAAPATFEAPLGVAALLSDRGPNKRTNEDGALVLPLDDEHLLLAVADGMGGLPDGDRAARLTLEALADALAPARRGAHATLGDAVVAGFERANAAVVAGAEGAGATLVAAVVGPGTLQVVHAGDAEALVVGQRGKLKLRTISHSPTGFALEQGLLTEREALVHQERHLVSNAIGLAPLTIEVGPAMRLDPRDTLVLASDGLFDNLTLAEVCERARTGPPERGAAALGDLARRRMRGLDRPTWPGKPDDLSLIVFRQHAARRA